MSNLREHNLLYARLEEVLGAEPAGILMSYIPTGSEVATKADLDALGDRLDARIDGLDARIDGLDARIDGLDARIDGLDGRLSHVESRLGRLEAHMERFDDKLDGFHTALREQARTYVLTMTGVMAAFASVVVATGILN
ncbi:MAG: hypothetical protein ABFS21_07885 [Actinomycetota bacterium]